MYQQNVPRHPLPFHLGNLHGLPCLPSLDCMPLRCLLFSSNKETIQPIWKVLAELDIEGEYCESAVDAVEKVTTHVFQIVITDWNDQPEATFLLKTARDQKAAQRPLTLAVIGKDDRPQALQAGANSVLLKPLAAEQIRDTLSTACQLLRARQQSSATPTPPPAASPTPATAVASAAAAPAPAASGLPLSVTQAPESHFRAGEFLQTPNSAPGAQFDTEKEAEVQKSMEEAAVAEVDALTDLEPTAAAVQESSGEPAEPAAEPVKVNEPLSGWAALQARLTKAAPQPPSDDAGNAGLLSYADTQAETDSSPASAVEEKSANAPAKEDKQSNTQAALPESPPAEHDAQPAHEQRPRLEPSRILVIAALATCACVAAVPKTRLKFVILSRSAAQNVRTWLNPPPTPVAQTVAEHDSFGQAGDEYKLPTPTNIPDATTDPSQIRVLPVVDPTAKPDKNADSNSAPAAVINGATSQPSAQGASGQTVDQTAATPAAVTANAEPAGPTKTTADSTSSAAAAPPAVMPPPATVRSTPPTPQTPLHTVSASTAPGIPSSLKTQLAPSTPEASGAMPPEAAMSSIEPVNLPESAVRELLAQSVDPEYPAAAKASGLRGSVTVQVTIGRDGTVQDAKFLQGSLAFARSALEAVKQWRFKPYSLNGRAVSVQSAITLTFKPPA